MLKRHADSSSAVTAACAALHAMTELRGARVDSSSTCHAIVRNGGLDALSSALIKHVSDERVVRPAVAVLAQLLPMLDVLTIDAASALPALAGVLTAALDHRDVAVA